MSSSAGVAMTLSSPPSWKVSSHFQMALVDESRQSACDKEGYLQLVLHQVRCLPTMLGQLVTPPSAHSDAPGVPD